MTNEDWTNIHPGFSEELRREWEGCDLTYQDAQEWISVGFKLSDYDEVENWKKFYFSPQQAKSWKNVIIEEYHDSYLEEIVKAVSYFRWKGYLPTSDLNIEEEREEFEDWYEESKPAQDYLDCFYPKSVRGSVKKLSTWSKELVGVLDLSDFANLEKLNCSNNELTALKLDNCLKLKKLDCSNNDFPDQDLSIFKEMINLEKLKVGNTRQARIDRGIFNRFYGSLKPLKDLIKLNELDISNTNLDTGLEYLPESLISLECSTKLIPEAKVKSLKQKLVNSEWEPIPYYSELQFWKIVNSDSVINRWKEEVKELKTEIKELEETIETERVTHEDFMKKSEEWSKRQKQELLDKIAELEKENERLKKQLFEPQTQVEISNKRRKYENI